MVRALKMMRTRKVQPWSQMARALRPMVMMARPIYHQALCSLIMYSSASQETEANFCVITLL